MLIQNQIYNNKFYNYRPGSSFNHNKQEEHEVQPLTKTQKGVILASSIAGMVPVLGFWARKKGFSLNPAKILKTPIKEWALFKYSPKEKSIQFKTPQITSVAAGSILGGFIGGSIADDNSNIKAKKREVLNQLLGNVIVPVACVEAGASVYAKYQDKIEGAMPQIKNKTSKTISFLNKVLRKVPNVLGTFGLLGVGVYLGNKVSNLINNKLYHKKVERNIKVSDFAPHFDDLCLAASMMNEKSSFGSALGRIIPLVLIVPGYQTGIARQKN